MAGTADGNAAETIETNCSDSVGGNADETAAETIDTNHSDSAGENADETAAQTFAYIHNQKHALRSGAGRPLHLFITTNPHLGQAQTRAFF